MNEQYSIPDRSTGLKPQMTPSSDAHRPLLLPFKFRSPGEALLGVLFVVALAAAQGLDLSRDASRPLAKGLFSLVFIFPILWVGFLRTLFRQLLVRFGAPPNTESRPVEDAGATGVALHGSDWQKRYLRRLVDRATLPFDSGRIFLSSLGPLFVWVGVIYICFRPEAYVSPTHAAIAMVVAFGSVILYCATNPRVYSCNGEVLRIVERHSETAFDLRSTRVAINLEARTIGLRDAGGREATIDLSEVARPERLAASIAKARLKTRTDENRPPSPSIY